MICSNLTLFFFFSNLTLSLLFHLKAYSCRWQGKRDWKVEVILVLKNTFVLEGHLDSCLLAHWNILLSGSVQCSHSVVSDSLRPRGLQHPRPPCPSPTPQSLLKFMSIESVMPSNHLILSCPFFLPFLPSIFPSIRVFSNESVLRKMFWNWK